MGNRGGAGAADREAALRAGQLREDGEGEERHDAPGARGPDAVRKRNAGKLRPEELNRGA